MSKKDKAVKPTKANVKRFDAVEVKGAHRKAVNRQIPHTAVPVRTSKHVSENEI
jgi:hypothetical protein